MDRSEYERRMRELEERLEASLEIVRSAHRVERRSLDFLWMTSPGNSTPFPMEAAAPLAQGFAPPVPPGATPEPAPQPLPPLPPTPRPVRWRSAELSERVMDLLDEMPEIFDRDDFLLHFGENPPERSMLYRVLNQLAWDGEIEVAQRGGGRTPVRYRRVDRDEPED